MEPDRLANEKEKEMKVVKIEYENTTFELERGDDNGEWSAPFGFSTSGGSATPGEALDEAIRFLDHLETMPAAERKTVRRRALDSVR